MSKITDFYYGGTDDSGRTLEDILKFKEGEMEMHHDYIQILFPTTEPSMFNDAPVLSEEDIKIFKNVPLIRDRLKTSIEKFLWFLGLKLGEKIEPNGDFDKRKFLLETFNHNHLRITRMIRCCVLCGYEDVAQKIVDFMKERKYGTLNSMSYWEKALVR